MTEDVSSARPARLVRFGDTTGAMDDGLQARFGALDEALAAYRGTCETQYRFIPTTETTDVLRAWGGGVADLGRWVKEVGQAFITSQVVDAYVDGFGDVDMEAVATLDDADVVAHLDEYGDDPFLGVPAGGWAIEDRDVQPDDPDAFGGFLDGLGLGSTISDEMLKGFNDLLANTPRSVTITVTLTETHMLFLSDGRVLARVTRAEATARLLLPSQVPSDLARASRWLGRVGGALDFATGAYTQWQDDAGLPASERLLRAGTSGAGAGLGGVGGGFLGGAAGGAAAGLVCGPGAPVCSSVLGIGGGILGAIAGSGLGGWAVGFLPWMDEPEEPLPGEYDLEVLHDELAQSDGTLSEHSAPLDAAVSLVASDLALAETADQPDVQPHLEPLLPDRDELLRIIEGVDEPESGPPTGTTTTTTPPSAPPEPSPGPAPEPFPSKTPTGTTVPSG